MLDSSNISRETLHDHTGVGHDLGRGRRSAAIAHGKPDGLALFALILKVFMRARLCETIHLHVKLGGTYEGESTAILR